MIAGTNRPTLCALADAALAEASDYDAAADALLVALDDHPDLRREAMANAERGVALALVRHAAGRARALAWRPAPAAAAGRRRMARLSAQVSASLLDFRLPDGSPLRDASAGTVRAAAAFYGDRAATMGHRARWLLAVADRLGNRTVAEALGEAELHEIQEETADAA